MAKRIHLILRFGFITFWLILHGFSEAQQCDEGRHKNGFIFPRTFFVTYKATIRSTPLPITKALMQETLGDCGDVVDLAEKAIKHLKKYGLDLEAAKQAVSVPIVDPRFTFAVHVKDPEASYVVVSETFYNYAKYLGTNIAYVSWVLNAEVEIKGPGGTLPAGYRDVFGMIRFKTNGRDFCIELRNRKPGLSFSNPVAGYDMLLYNKYWKAGVSRGLALNRNGTLRVIYTMTFPAEP